MTWLIIGIYVALLSMIVDCVVVTANLPPVHWNSTNPMFRPSNNDHILDVKLYDAIDFVCPQYSEDTPEDQMEHYIVYRVTEQEYEQCNLFTPTRIMIVNCSSPKSKRKYTLLFEEYSGVPGGSEYDYGASYFFITTSIGTKEGVNNQYQGACADKNMKLKVNVCCTKSSSTNAPTGGPVVTEAPPTPTTPPQRPTTRRPRPITSTTTIPTTTTTQKEKDKDKNEIDENETTIKSDQNQLISSAHSHHRLHLLTIATTIFLLLRLPLQLR